jgi:cold shock CspA family protein
VLRIYTIYILRKEKMQGLIKTFDLNKGEGIIIPENGGQEITINIVECPVVGVDKLGRKNYRIPRESERVSYEPIIDSFGNANAKNLVFISTDDNGDDLDMD